VAEKMRTEITWIFKNIFLNLPQLREDIGWIEV